MRARSVSLLWLTTLAGLGACSGAAADRGRDEAPGDPGAPATGKPGKPGTPGSSGGGGADGTDPGRVSGGPASAARMPLRRLTRREYDNTVRDLLGDASRPARSFVREPFTETGFAVAAAFSPLETQAAQAAAEKLAEAAVAPAALGKLLPCAAELGAAPTRTAEEACARRFVDGFARRAYRRPLEADERAELEGLFAKGRTLGFDFAGSVGLVLQAILQAPSFLYHWEVGPGKPARDGALVKLGPYQVASRLSYFLWGTMPDDALFAAAEANALGTEAQVLAQAKRMLADKGRAADTLRDFALQWLRVDGLPDAQKDAKAYGAFDAKLAGAMMDELAALVGDVVLAGDGRAESLLLAPHSFVNEPLAKLYGVTTVRGEALQKATLEPRERRGVLTSLAFLTASAGADSSHPVNRGQVVYRQLLCGELPAQPVEVPPLPPPSPTVPTRQRFAQHAESPCAGCHKLFDAFGFAFEHYDALGRFRATDGGKPVDATGKAPLPGGGEIVFKDALELAQGLSTSADVRRCLVQQWFRYALGRREEAADAASLEALQKAFAAARFDLRELLLAITTTKSFLYRAPGAGEVL